MTTILFAFISAFLLSLVLTPGVRWLGLRFGAETQTQPSHPRRQNQRKQKSANECKQDCGHIKLLQVLITHCSLLCYSLLWETKPVLYAPADEPKIVDRQHRVAGGGVKSSNVRWPGDEDFS